MEFNLKDKTNIKEFGASLAKDSIIMVLWEATFNHLPGGDKLRPIYIDRLKDLAEVKAKNFKIKGLEPEVVEAIWKEHKEKLLEFAEHHKASI